ncbi:MAG: recombinase family protein [Oscillospiraceae bacterium]|nr:recombinase family protein [Oscillospiraceae bacterium]
MSIYTIARYLRISSEDVDIKSSGKLESNSISNQRNLLNDYIKHIPEFDGAEVIEFCDDGWSGKNFDRPAVQEMLRQARQGKIQCIIVKDMSRFGRDYLIVGNYISRVFPFLEVRFIAVNDGIDSIRSTDIDSLDTSFKALLYDYYSRDLSRKIRSAKRLRAQQGEYMCTYAPYGYNKDPHKKNHLVIDPPAAEIVRRIFHMVAEGRSTTQTAKILNQEGVLTPMRYKRAAGCSNTTWNCIREENFWTDHSVIGIIRDECYLGKAIQGKRVNDIIGQRHSVKISQKDWIVVSDTHEGIVTQEEFDRAQAAVRKFVERESVNKPMRRKVRCGTCGHAMTRIGAAKHPYYICQTSRVTDLFSCFNERIAETDIFNVLLVDLQTQAETAVGLERLWKEKYQCQKNDIGMIRKSLSKLKGTLSQQKQQMTQLYERFGLGEISKEEYLAMKAVANQEKDSIIAKISELETLLENTGAEGNLDNRFVSSFQKYVDVQEITGEIMEDLLKEVVVYPEGRLEIVWNYREELNRMILDVTP